MKTKLTGGIYMFSNLYRVLAKDSSMKKFRGTGEDNGNISFQDNVIHQSFYQESDAIKLSESLRGAGFETKVVKGS